jgi:hypothetical protein
MAIPKVGMKIKCTKSCDCGCGLTAGQTFVIKEVLDNSTVIVFIKGRTVVVLQQKSSWRYNAILLEDKQIEFDF